MKITVKKCVTSFKYANMYVVTCNRVKEDFFTGAKVPGNDFTIISKVEIPVGEQDVRICSTKDRSKHWIEALKEVK